MSSKYFKVKQWFALSLCLFLGLSYASQVHADVRSLMPAEYVQYSANEIYWEVSVNCINLKKPRVIRQESGLEQWCSKDFPDICGSSKMRAAIQVCNSKFNRLMSEKEKEQEAIELEEKKAKEAELAQKKKEKEEAERLAREKAEAEDPLNIEKNQIAIESKRIQIEQQQLDLRREALELRQQELDIQLQLKDNQ